MAFVNEASCECAKSELDLFAVQPTQTSIEEANVEYLPINSTQNRALLDFVISRIGDHYIDMVNIRAKVTQGSDTNLAVDATVAPVNIMLHSMFS